MQHAWSMHDYELGVPLCLLIGQNKLEEDCGAKSTDARPLSLSPFKPRELSKASASNPETPGQSASPEHRL